MLFARCWATTAASKAGLGLAPEALKIWWGKQKTQRALQANLNASLNARKEGLRASNEDSPAGGSFLEAEGGTGVMEVKGSGTRM